jgi:hypothetical protein
MSSKPRALEHFPKMKYRARKRHLDADVRSVEAEYARTGNKVLEFALPLLRHMAKGGTYERIQTHDKTYYVLNPLKGERS